MKAATKASPRERILDAASTLFYRDGIRAIGVDTIVSASGVAKMTLYHHFGSKNGLIVAVLERRSREWIEGFRAAVEARASQPRARLDCVFDVLREWFESPDFRGCTFANAKAELASPEHPAHATLREHFLAVRGYLRQLALAAGLSAARAERVACDYQMLINGATAERCLTGASDAALRAKQAARILMGE